MSNIVLSQYVKNNLNAGPKAKVDVEEILKQHFDFQVKTVLLKKDGFKNSLEKYFFFIKKLLYVKANVKPDDFVVIQAPFSNKLSITKHIKNKVAFIHDIEGLRGNDEKLLNEELNFFNTCRYIICHNSVMKQYLLDHGVDEKKIYVLELFDYLCNDKATPQKNTVINEDEIKLVYTGNLDKAPFLKQLDSEKMNFHLNIYGIMNGNIDNEKITYMGKYLPEELPGILEGDLGLVWDGNLDESDENTGFKNYTKYNNPHKISCYLAAGMPVVVWNKSALADFVKSKNIGYCINDLYDINKLNFEDYETKKTNAIQLSRLITDGIFTQNIIKQIKTDINKG